VSVGCTGSRKHFSHGLLAAEQAVYTEQRKHSQSQSNTDAKASKSGNAVTCLQCRQPASGS
jgi:hypothetical protein